MLADGAFGARKDARIIHCPLWSKRSVSESMIGTLDIKRYQLWLEI